MLPIFKILFFWIVGILLLPFNPFTCFQLVIILILLACLFLFFHFSSSNTTSMLEHVTLVFFLVGIVFFFYSNLPTPNQVLQSGKEYRVIVKVKERYKQTPSFTKYIVEVQSYYDEVAVPYYHDFLFYQKRDTLLAPFLPGDVVEAQVYCSHFTEVKHADLFDSKQFWNRKGIYAILWMKNKPRFISDPYFSLYSRIRRLQEKLINDLNQQNISAESKQLLAALLLGAKKSVTKPIASQFSRLGLSHVLALSGLHISLLYGVCAFLVSLLFKHQPITQSLLLSLVILFYAVLTGLSPSVMRASLMFLLYAFTLLVDRRTSVYNVIFLSAFILLVFQPNLLYSVGFQLSYMALIGIVYFYTKFAKYSRVKSYFLQFVFGISIVSIAAQLSTGILSVYYFNSFPVSFLWSNIIVLPLITYFLYLGLLYLVFVVLNFNFELLDILVDCSTSFILGVVSRIDAFSFAPIQLYFSVELVLLLYGFLCVLCLVFLEKKFEYLKLLYGITLVLSVFFLNDTQPKKQVFVNASKKGYVISMLANREQVLISNNYDATPYLLGKYTMRNKIVCVDSLRENSLYQNEFCSLSKGLVQLFDQKFLFLSDRPISKICLNESVDLIFLKNYRQDLVNVVTYFSPKMILLDPKITAKKRFLLEEQCHKLEVSVLDLSSAVYVKTY